MVSPTKPPLNGGFWKAVSSVLAGIIATGVAAWLIFGVNTVNRAEFGAALEMKANKETIEAQLENIGNQLQSIDDRLDRMEGQ